MKLQNYRHLMCLSVFVLSACGTSATPKSAPQAAAEKLPALQAKNDEKAPSVEKQPLVRAENPIAERPDRSPQIPLPVDPRNIDGYGKTRWGMTEKQVIAAEADRIERLDEPVPFGAQGKPPIGIATLMFRRFEIDGREYEAFFQFDPQDERLVRVLIRSLETNDAISNSQRFVSLEQLLTEKYGPPTFSTSGKQRSESSAKSIASWKLTTTSIELKHTDYKIAGGSLLTLVYEALKAKEKSSDDL